MIRRQNIPLLCAYLLAVIFLGFLVIRSAGYGWDFYYAWTTAKAFFTEGVSPYLRVSWPYCYPPFSLQVYRPFALLPYVTALRLWIALKILSFGVLFFIWNKYFLSINFKKAFSVFFFALAFNGSLFYDIASGSVTGFQQLILWLALLALLKNRTVLFAVLIAIITQIKPDLLPFLGLLLFVPDKPAWFEFVAGLVIYFFIFSMSFVVYPDLAGPFVRNFLMLNDHNRGINNPSSVAFCRDLFGAFRSMSHPILLPKWTPEICYLAWVIFVLVTSYRTWKYHRRFVNSQDKILTIFFFCIVFSIITPRIPPYSYILPLLPAFYALTKMTSTATLSGPALLILLPMSKSSFPGPFATMIEVGNCYLPLFGAIWIWALYCRQLRRGLRDSVGGL